MVAKQRKWFVILGIFASIITILNFPMIIEWYFSSKHCNNDKDYRVCQQLLEEYQKDRAKNLETDSDIFNQILNKKFGLNETQIRASAENFATIVKTDYDRGLALAGQNKHEEAVEYFDTAIKLNNTEPTPYFAKAMSQYIMAYYQNASDTLNKLGELGYFNSAILTLRALIFDKQNDPDKTLLYYNEALRIYPDNAELWHNRGHVQGKLGDCNGAIESYDKALDVDDPNNILTLDNKAIALLICLKNYTAAINIYTKILELNPDYQKAYDNRAYGYYKIKEFELALEDRLKSLKFDGDNPNLCRIASVVELLVILGKDSEANAYHEQAIKKDPNYMKTCARS